MASQPFSWSTLLYRLGLRRQKRRSRPAVRYRRQLRFEQCEDRAMLAPITVTSYLDNGDGAKLTLREAIEQANANNEADTISFSTNPADGLNGATITLLSGELDIDQDDNLTIDASM
jgi:hypothetical protein